MILKNLINYINPILLINKILIILKTQQVAKLVNDQIKKSI